MRDPEFEAVYRIQTTPQALERRVEALLLEQTVELPRSALKSRFARESILGRIAEMEPAGPGAFRVTLAQTVAATASDPAQFLNVLFGNCSLQADVELEDVRVPPELAAVFGGPRFGILGFRSATGVHGRALSASALKPLGLSPSEVAQLCGTFARAGIDVIKDDHGLADHPFCPFEERVRACLEAVDRAAQETGRLALYVPNLIGSPAVVKRQASQARAWGARAVMVSPMLLGLPFLCELTRELGLPILAHPAFGGALRISPGALLGKLFPLFGADAVIFPSAGGRFSYDAPTCAGIAEALLHPETGILAALPVPAGGVALDRVESLLGLYGPDAMLLVGGGLLESPDSDTLIERSRRFAQTLAQFSYASP